MIIVLYLVLLLAFLILENYFSEKDNLHGLFFAAFVFVLGISICPQLRFIAVILVSANLARAIVLELKLMNLSRQ